MEDTIYNLICCKLRITQDSQGRHEGDVTNKALFTPLNGTFNSPGVFHTLTVCHTYAVIPETGIASSQATTKQGRGRPLGSRNKVQHPPVQLAKRPRGRPRLVNKPTSPKPKHAIGRPPKPKPLPTIVKVGGLNCVSDIYIYIYTSSIVDFVSNYIDYSRFCLTSCTMGNQANSICRTSIQSATVFKLGRSSLGYNRSTREPY